MHEGRRECTRVTESAWEFQAKLSVRQTEVPSILKRISVNSSFSRKREVLREHTRVSGQVRGTVWTFIDSNSISVNSNFLRGREIHWQGMRISCQMRAGNWTLVSFCSRLASVLQVTKYHDFIECYSSLRLKKLNTIFAERARRGGCLAISSAESPVDMLCSWLCLRIQKHISLFNTETILVHCPHFKKYKIVLKLMRENIHSGFTQKLRNKLSRVFHDF